ncbi:Signal recognition particle 54 kDa protein [Seminavis robusta]|uniref:signal-recognition-particle GTPase n=1 Tax=Seminavis robusta TaxID=568900 RepID=A0A9N8DDK6_9STRA|nr:Signal recognition particle 54 kDa protein [Seminavis robusta]|eukprot:Sro74_g040740.1 Signal recognition particle 54 kDa protein (599) ;mRNA; f:52124-54156
MVLAELGGKLRESLRKLHSSSGRVTKDQLNALLSDISRALIESDVNVKMVMTMREQIKTKVMTQIEAEESKGDDQDDQNRRSASHLSKTVQKAVVDELTNLLNPENKAYSLKKGKANVVLFVGLQGSGKTTSIAKFANYHQKRGWKTAMVCADTFRAGAFDQLKQNATKLRVPFYGSYTEADPVLIAEDGVNQFKKEKYEVIIVDTSGRHKQESALFEEMQEISAAVKPNNTVLVIDATQGQAVFDQALAFHSAVDVGSVIVTKLDGGAKGGGALSAVAATESPIIFTGTGEHFEDLESFHPESFVSKLLGYGDMRGLAEAFKSVDGDGKDTLMKQLELGKFCLRDMYNQFQKVLSMGSMQKLMGYMPGMPEYLIPKGGDQEATGRLKKFMYMMDSMTNAELDGKVDLSKKDDPKVQSRIRRIAAGSGTHIQEVMMLLQVHRQFEGMVGKSKGLFGKNAQAKQQQMAEQMRRNPNLIQQRLNQMDPRMLQQMGGRDKVAAMMQQMAKGGGAGGAGGMPDMSTMMNAMGGMGGMPGMGGGMPDMSALMGGGGMPNMGGGGGAGMPGMPPGMDMDAMMKMAQSMGLGGPGMMGPGGPGRR